MSLALESFNDLIERGDVALNTGHLPEAHQLFSAAREKSKTLGPRRETFSLQMLGIVLRLLGRLDEALATFNVAVSMVPLADVELLAKILRDRSLVHLRLGDFDSARQDIGTSLDLLRQTGKHHEYYCSLGFSGEIADAEGKRREAYLNLAKANQHLRGHHPYELNNLVRLMRVARFPARQALLPRAVWLSVRPLNRLRVIEVLVLACGGRRFHDWLRESRLRRPQRS